MDCTTAEAAYCDAGSCRACVAHSECASDLCDVDTGTCVDESTIIYVAPAGSTSSICTRADPCSVDRAAEVVATTRPNVKFAEGTHVATAPSAGGVRWYFPTPVGPNLYGPAVIAGPFGFAGTGVFRLRDLQLESLTVCGGGNLATPTLDAARITIPQGTVNVHNVNGRFADSKVVAPPVTGSAIQIGNSVATSLTIDRVEIVGARYGVYVAIGSIVEIKNSIIRDQDLYFSTTRSAIGNHPEALIGTASFTTFYNTVLLCPDSTNEVKFHSRNNIFVNDAPGAPANTVSGKQCSHNYDIIKPQSATPVGGNNLLNSDPHFANPTAGNFHLTTGSIAIDTADPAAIEMFDFDGTMRPQGSARDIGAFEFKP
jgi:hypothetical protein